MSRCSGIGENRLREMISNGEIDYIPIGNRRLISDQAIINWYETHKISASKGDKQDGHFEPCGKKQTG